MKKYIKKYPGIFDLNEDVKYHSISDDQIPDISWFYEKNHEPIVKRNRRQIKPSKHWYLSKRVLVSIIAIFIFCIFLVATPTGRAMVKIVYHTVVEWLTGEVHIWHGTDDAPPEQVDLKNNTFESIHSNQYRRLKVLMVL
jgi:hypothetical protein